MDIDKQRERFELALAQLVGLPGLINQALEVTEREDGSVDIVFYAIPAD